MLWGVSYGGEGRGQGSRPRSLLSSLNEAECQEVLGLGLQFAAREVLVVHSSQHGLSRRDHAGAASVVTQRRGGRRSCSGATMVHN